MSNEPGRERSKSTRFRRELLAGAAGAVGVLAAESLARVPTAQATQGKPIIAGQDNSETSPTTITNTGGFGWRTLGLRKGRRPRHPGLRAWRRARRGPPGGRGARAGFGFSASPPGGLGTHSNRSG